MKKPMVPVCFVECFLIFWNIFMVSTEDVHTIIWEKEIPNINITNFNQHDVLRLDHEWRIIIGEPADDIGRFMYHYSGSESKSIGFIISSCKAVEIQWILRFKPENKTNEETNHNFQLETLAERRGTEVYIYTEKALRGEYYLEVWSAHRQTYFMYVTMTPTIVDLLRQVNEKKHERALRFKKNLKKFSVTFQWPEWSWKDENETVIYVVMWSNQKYVTSGCEREHYMSDIAEIYITRNRTCELYEESLASSGEVLYVSVFIKTMKTKEEFLLPYLRGRVTFQNTPVTLKDGIPAKKYLTADDDRLTFRYKVRNRPFPGSEDEILWYVISCVGDVQIEINHKKDPVLKKQVVSQYKAFRISQPHVGNRYVLKVTDTNGESEKNIEVFATMRSKLFPFPDVNNFDLKAFPNQNHNIRNKISYTVAWHAASDKTPIHYCMRVYNTKDEENSNIWEINQCTRMKKKFSNVGGFVGRNCTKSGSRSIITLPIYDLDPASDYVVYVSARKQGFKPRLWYNTLRIRRNFFLSDTDLPITT